MVPTLPELRFAKVDGQACGLDGDRLTYREAGEAHKETVLLMHGIGSHAGGWRFILDGLSDSHRLIAWNAPGYYLSDNFAADAPDHSQYANAAVALLDSLGVETCHVVGSSFGSMIGTTLAALHPERVQTLTLLGASRGQFWRPAEE
ncbi:MAG: alpha/beta fold hydrolase, partial [Rhodospirillaceae bacterium]|nr:alpha/beta fold hydrolase [Rhodospirillaceae bacterium]